ncbi:MAG TPA: nuclear transport factor 2 family protein [Ramlibacter sp.]|nr:nuclear transport factor 2 family protein [Ramlibacter sp.]
MKRAQGLYAALNSGDADALQRLLAVDFIGQLAPGLPVNLGRRYDGLHAMLSEAWAEVDRLFQLEVKADRFFDTGEVLVVHGTYEGIARATGKALHAGFAHFWQFDGTRFTGLQQVTDTAMWRDALV